MRLNPLPYDLSDTLPEDPCRVLGGKKSGNNGPLPLYLQQSLIKFRRTWGRKRPSPHRATPSSLGASCVCRYLLAHGFLKHAMMHPWAYPPGQLIHPKPTRWFQLDINNFPFASFLDPAEAYSYAISLKSIDAAKTAVFMSLKV
jgi:hypothetical protein